MTYLTKYFADFVTIFIPTKPREISEAGRYYHLKQ